MYIVIYFVSDTPSYSPFFFSPDAAQSAANDFQALDGVTGVQILQISTSVVSSSGVLPS